MGEILTLDDSYTPEDGCSLSLAYVFPFMGYDFPFMEFIIYIRFFWGEVGG